MRFCVMAAIAASALAFSTAAPAQTPIRFSLDWRFESPNSGFMVAIDKGYFKAEGLDVTMDPGAGSVDGIECVWFPDADATSMAVAAASIIAKTERDSLMERFAEVYPQYGFERHAGYGAPEHITAIRSHGMIPGLHRSTFVHLESSEDDG